MRTRNVGGDPKFTGREKDALSLEALALATFIVRTRNFTVMLLLANATSGEGQKKIVSASD